MIKKIKRIFYRSMNEKDINYKTVQKMQTQKNTILVDVRSIQEYEEEHLPGAICICLYHLRNQVLDIIPNKKATIIVYCSSGSRSKEAQIILEKLGYENVYNLKGGLEEI